jgi:hypothetical protein
MKTIRPLLLAVCVLGASALMNAAHAMGVRFGSPPPVTAAPEPATLVLMASGLAAVGLSARRLRRKRPDKD